MHSDRFKDLKEWNAYKDAMSKIYGKMLFDFMSPNGDHYDFLSDEEFKMIHEMGDGIYDLYNIPRNEWEKSYTLDHVMNSSFERKKRMAERILELISYKGYQLNTKKSKISGRLALTK